MSSDGEVTSSDGGQSLSARIEAQLKLLLDREAIRDVVMRYCHGTDRSDEEVLRSVYWPEATDDHGVFSGPASDYIPFLLKAASGMDQMQHLVGNMLIRNADDSAGCESYFIAYHRVRDAQAQPYDMIIGGRYLDELERRGAEWRILRRKVVYDWFRNFEGSADWSQGVGGAPVTMGARAPGDSSAEYFSHRDLTGPPF